MTPVLAAFPRYVSTEPPGGDVWAVAGTALGKFAESVGVAVLLVFAGSEPPSVAVPALHAATITDTSTVISH